MITALLLALAGGPIVLEDQPQNQPHTCPMPHSALYLRGRMAEAGGNRTHFHVPAPAGAPTDLPADQHLSGPTPERDARCRQTRPAPKPAPLDFEPPPQTSAARDWLALGVLGAGAADLATTQWGFATMPGGRDVNPLVRGPASAVLVKAGTTAGVLLLDRHLQRTGHRRAGKVLKVAAIVVWGGAAAWNARQLRKHGR